MRKICPNPKCKREFNSFNPKEKSCCPKCSDSTHYYNNRERKLKHMREYCRKYYKRDFKRKSAYFKKWYQRNKEEHKRKVMERVKYLQTMKGGKSIMEYKKIEPSIWKPEKEGDEIEGVLIGVKDSKKFDNKIYQVESDGNQVIIFGTTVLDDRMSYLKPGDPFKIIFKGTEKSKKGQDTKIFEVLKGEVAA